MRTDGTDELLRVSGAEIVDTGGLQSPDRHRAPDRGKVRTCASTPPKEKVSGGSQIVSTKVSSARPSCTGVNTASRNRGVTVSRRGCSSAPRRGRPGRHPRAAADRAHPHLELADQPFGQAAQRRIAVDPFHGELNRPIQPAGSGRREGRRQSMRGALEQESAPERPRRLAEPGRPRDRSGTGTGTPGRPAAAVQGGLVQALLDQVEDHSKPVRRVHTPRAGRHQACAPDRVCAT